MNTLSPHRPVRFGILGCAKIAEAFARDLRGSPWAQVVAVASRDRARAEGFAARHGIARHHGSYEALIDDPGVEVIYLPLPNGLHMHWCLQAVAGRKHVLCEKPLSLGLAQARAMFDGARANGVMLLESYPYWFQPQTGDLLELLRADGPAGIGPARFVQACFGFSLNQAAPNIRWDPQLGGGALLDAGSYPVSLIRLVMGERPISVRADSTWRDSGVDISTRASLSFSDGRSAQMSCTMDAAYHCQAVIVGRDGTVETEFLNHTTMAPGHPWGHLPSLMRVRKSTAGSAPFETPMSATGSGFRFAAEAFGRVIRAQDHGAIDRAASASLDIAATLEAIAQSARQDKVVAL